MASRRGTGAPDHASAGRSTPGAMAVTHLGRWLPFPLSSGVYRSTRAAVLRATRALCHKC
jgi:hypothetical protein